MKKLIFVLFAALAAVNAWATADVTWSLGGAFDYEPAAGVWVGSSEEGGEQITSGHLYLCFTLAGEDSQMNNWITQLTSLSSNSGLDGACVGAMTAFLSANSQWNGYNASNPNFSANCYTMTGGAFGAPTVPGQESPSVVTIDGIDANNAYDVVAIIFDTQDITADSKYVVIKGYGEQNFYTHGNDLGRLEIGFSSECREGDIDNGYAMPNNTVDGWHTVGSHSMPETFTDGIKKCANCSHEEYDQPQKDTDNKTYLIANTGNLLWFRDFVNTKTGDNYPNLSACAKLTANIVVNDGEFDEDGNFIATGDSEASTPRSWTPIGPDSYSDRYTGTFDGDGHTISGLYCKDSDEMHLGLFRYCGNGATVKGVGIEYCYFNCGGGAIGAICSENHGTIDGCYSSGTITSTGNTSAGLCRLNIGTVSNCYSTCSVSAPDAVGGICVTNRGTLKNCYFAGELSNATNKGGICYINQVSNGSAGTVTNCYTTFDTAILDNNTASGTKVYCVETKTADAFSKGEIAYKLNGSVDASGTWTAGTGTPVWYQKLGDDGDDYPVLKKASDGSNTVYYGYKNCTLTYANTALSETPAHDYQVVKDDQGKATWTWANDNSTATLKVVCTHNAEHIENFITVGVVAENDGMVNYPVTVTVNYKNMQNEASKAHTVSLYNGEDEIDYEDVASLAAYTAADPVVFPFTPHATGTLNLKVKIDDEDDDEVASVVINQNVKAESGDAIKQVGEKTGMTNGVIGQSYNRYRTEWIMKSSDLGLANGTEITSLTLKYYSTSKDVTKKAKIYLMSTEDDVVSGTAFTAVASLTPNYSNDAYVMTKAGSATEPAEMKFVFDNPYTYDGKNIRIVTDFNGSNYTGIYFETAAGKSLYYRADGSTDTSDSNSASSGSVVPVAYLSYSVQPKTFAGEVTKDGNPAEGIEVVAKSKTKDVEYYATTGSDGKYTMNVFQDDLEYTLTVTNTRGYEGETTIDNGSFVNSNNFTLTRHKVHVSIGEHQYTTFYDGVYDMIIPEGFKAWTAIVQGEEIIYTELSGYIPFGTGVLLYCGDIIDTNILSATEEVENNVTDNFFFGYDDDKTPESSVYKYYELKYSEEENRVGFYWGATDGAPFLCKAHKAYIGISSSSPAEKFTDLPMDDKNSTAIRHTPTISKRDGAVYNLSGQKVSPNYKGIVIKNGKKVIQ